MRDAILALCLALSCGAQAVGDDQPQEQTGVWLELQREGRAASTQVQSATPTERELSHQRWLESFKHAIPDFYQYDSDGSDR